MKPETRWASLFLVTCLGSALLAGQSPTPTTMGIVLGPPPSGSPWNLASQRYTNVVTYTDTDHDTCSLCLLSGSTPLPDRPRVPSLRWTVTTVGVRHTLTADGFHGELVKYEILSVSTNVEARVVSWVPTNHAALVGHIPLFRHDAFTGSLNTPYFITLPAR